MGRKPSVSSVRCRDGRNSFLMSELGAAADRGEGPAVTSSGSRLCSSSSFDRQKFQRAEALPGDWERLTGDGGAWREAPRDRSTGLLEREEEEEEEADCMVAWWVSGGVRRARPVRRRGMA
ncbi:hypothetical protein DY262_08410 [Hydrogenophaga borbori]|uniref:Uncharacterized protein n=1 Tax=Hydrogenophaga borbori TaxID=2294117 RepID=A0A372EM98_9BURK|nr:hypothetical protein DY262_08410 [Hydrogenophaga borbori]